MLMRTVVILSKPQKEELATLIPELILWMRAHGLNPVLDPVSGNGITMNGTYTGSGAVSSIAKAKSIMNGDLGFAKDDEHSDWTQYQPFLEWDIHPLDDQDLTITPGVKYVHWNHAVSAPVAQGNLCGVGASSGTYNATTNPTGTNGFCPNAVGANYTESFITRKVLPFAEVNYKIEPSWSVYFQYAQGIYVPDIGVFEE